MIGSYEPGPLNAITDVEGVLVGHSTLIRGEGSLEAGVGPVRTGVTAIFPNARDIFEQRVMGGGFVLNGAGELTGLTQLLEWGLVETPIVLCNTHAVGTSSQAVTRYMVKNYASIGVEHDVLIPLVGECDDSWLHDIAGRHVKAEHVYAALHAAKAGPVEEGSVGGGTGMICCDLKAGIGTSSRIVSGRGVDGMRIGVLVMSNFGVLEDLRVAGFPLGAQLAHEWGDKHCRLEDYGSIIAVVATDAPLLPNQVTRLCKRAALGIARAGSIAAHGSGEIVVGFSTGCQVPRNKRTPMHNFNVLDDRAIDPLYRATADATEEAILNAMCAAEPMTGRDGHHAPALPLDRVRKLARISI